MKKNLLTLVVITSVLMVSCLKSSLPTPINQITGKTSDLIVPKDFTWENSKTINFTINLTDTRFKGTMQVIAIYNGDPKSGGIIISKGSGIPGGTFLSKLYISNQITEVYITKTAADGSKITRKVLLSSANITTSIGM